MTHNAICDGQHISATFFPFETMRFECAGAREAQARGFKRSGKRRRKFNSPNAPQTPPRRAKARAASVYFADARFSKDWLTQRPAKSPRSKAATSSGRRTLPDSVRTQSLSAMGTRYFGI